MRCPNCGGWLYKEDEIKCLNCSLPLGYKKETNLKVIGDRIEVTLFNHADNGCEYSKGLPCLQCPFPQCYEEIGQQEFKKLYFNGDKPFEKRGKSLRDKKGRFLPLKKGVITS